jgi:hypothetical protein
MSQQPDSVFAGTQVVSLVEIRGTNHSLVHPRGAVGSCREIYICLLLLLFSGLIANAQNYLGLSMIGQQPKQNGAICINANGTGVVGSAFVFGKSNYVVTCKHEWDSATNRDHFNAKHLYYFYSISNSLSPPYALTPKCFITTNDIAVFTTTPPLADIKPFQLTSTGTLRSNDLIVYFGFNSDSHTFNHGYGHLTGFGVNNTSPSSNAACIYFQGNDHAHDGYSGGAIFTSNREVVGIFCGGSDKVYAGNSIDALSPLLTN